MKKKKHKTDDEVEDDEGDEEEDEEELEDEHEVEYEDEDEEDAGDDIKKKPASGMKRPATVIAKKPSGNRPKPVFDKPLHWGGRSYLLQ